MYRAKKMMVEHLNSLFCRVWDRGVENIGSSWKYLGQRLDEITLR